MVLAVSFRTSKLLTVGFPGLGLGVDGAEELEVTVVGTGISVVGTRVSVVGTPVSAVGTVVLLVETVVV